MYLKNDKTTSSIATKKPYDPSQFSESLGESSSASLKESENKLKLMEYDYKSLREKRLKDVSFFSFFFELTKI